MKVRMLTVSLVLLLIAVAALPGLSFSLGSSVTSYNNSISYIDYDQYGISIPSGNHVAEPKTEVVGIRPSDNIKSIIGISNPNSNGCFSSGEGEVEETIYLAQDVSFKIFIQSYETQGLLVSINGVKYIPPFGTGGYVSQPESGDIGDLTSLNDGTVFSGTKVVINTESEENNSTVDGNRVYIYFVMLK